MTAVKCQSLVRNPRNVGSEFQLRLELERSIDSVLMVDQLQELCYDGISHEYREYSLVSRTQRQGVDFGNIDDMITVYHQWKIDATDRSFKVFLEYEIFKYDVQVMKTTGITKEIGLVLKIEKP